MVRTSTSSDFCTSHFSVCLLDRFPVCLLKVEHSKRYVLKEASVTNTGRKLTGTVLNYSLLQNYTSTNGHKFPWLNSTYTPLSIYLSNTGFKGPWRPFAQSHKDPESYISSSHSQSQTQHSAEGSSLNHLFSSSSSRSGGGRGVEPSSTLNQHMPGQLNLSPHLPAAKATAGERQRSAKCLASHTQTLSRKLLLYS